MKIESLPQDLQLRFNIARELGHTIDNHTVMMDFGCGSGKKVQELRNQGFNAFGCGTRFNEEKNVETDLMLKNEIIREIKIDQYRIPFEDSVFDFIFSESVFEHVGNYPETIAELSRVLKPGGLCIHTFVSRYKPIEAHVLVPFGSVFQSYWWLYTWILLGCKNEWPASNINERVSKYQVYLKKETNYLKKKQLEAEFLKSFGDVRFCEDLLLKYSPGKRKHLYPLSKVLPFIPKLFSTFQMRVIVTKKPIKH